MSRTRINTLMVYAPYALLSVLIMGPLLAPGYVLSMDMVFTPVLRLAGHVDNTWLLYAVLHVLDWLLPADVVQKLVLFAALFLSGAGMHRLLLRVRPTSHAHWDKAVYVGGVLYTINPFVYDRLMAGQWGVWLGYALLPWFTACLLGFVRRPGFASALRLAAWAVALSIVSIHAIGLMAVLVLVAVSICIYRRARLRQLAAWGLASIGVYIAASSYWLVPTVLGSGRIADSIQAFTAEGRPAFATVDAVGTGQVGAVLGLMGFWQEGRELYMLPIESYAWWGLSYLAVLVLLALGMVQAWRAQRHFAVYAIVVAGVGIVLAVGIGGEWLAQVLPFFAGYREPQKFAALVALVYGYAAAWGAVWILNRITGWKPRIAWGSAILLALLPLAYTPTMLWGAAGQLRPADYPSDWFVANEVLRKEPDEDKVLVLPWHLYMSYPFTERIIASPAIAFFDRGVIASDDPELPGVMPQTRHAVREELQGRVLPLLREGQDVTVTLRKLGISYIILHKTVDWHEYGVLDVQQGIVLLHEGPTLKLYRILK